MPDPVFLILAAGESSRFGQPKQLLELNQETLLARAIRVVSEAKATPLVVLGARHTRLKSTIGSTPSVFNPNWSKGIASSIVAGFEWASLHFANSPVGIMLVDQPSIGTAHLASLIESMSDWDIACTHYDSGPGVPALFSAETAPLLAKADGDRGAREILRHELHLSRYRVKVFENWDTVDIDEPADWTKFLGTDE